jgi:hypothetical protein
MSAEERTLAALEMLGREFDGLDADGKLNGHDDKFDGQLPAHPVPLGDRVRRLPEAVLFTAGYYASRVPMLNELIRRLD